MLGYANQNEKVNSYVNYLNDEIDIRVESLKLELEKIGEELKGDLIKLTDEIIKLVSFKKKNISNIF